ncbi:NADH pyrophosphatase zinc ribbon domain-containing protein, partial [Acinetobacter junii]|uniref:NADH pyrophosphatase zinc ribbon domain-containing protein n=1 Tax=Acinetobacter junii TaxID=40215 RepID=UPI002356EA4F
RCGDKTQQSTDQFAMMCPSCGYNQYPRVNPCVITIITRGDDDRSKILGRPILYVVIDVFSRMVVGFYIGFHNPSYVVAMQA